MDHKITSVILSRPACITYRLALWLTLLLVSFNSKAQNAKQMTDSGFHKMTIIRIYPDYSKDFAEVIFSESARFYQLPVTAPVFSAQLKLLQAAYKKRKSVWIKTTIPNGVVIQEIRECTSK